MNVLMKTTESWCACSHPYLMCLDMPQIQWECCLCVCMSLRVCKMLLNALSYEQHFIICLQSRCVTATYGSRASNISTGTLGILGDLSVWHKHHTCSNATASVLIIVLIHHHQSTRCFEITFYFCSSMQLRTLSASDTCNCNCESIKTRQPRIE